MCAVLMEDGNCLRQAAEISKTKEELGLVGVKKRTTGFGRELGGSSGYQLLGMVKRG